MTHKKQPPRSERGGGKSQDRAGRSISSTDIIAKLRTQPGRLIDRFGLERDDRVLDNWSAEACIVMGLHRVDDGGEP